MEARILLGGAPEGVKLILRWLRNHPEVEVFPESELTRVVPPLRKDRAMMEDGLNWLAQRKVIRRHPEPARPKGTRGRKPAPVWEVHPELRDLYNTENAEKSHPAADTDPPWVNSPNSPYSTNPVSANSREVFEL